MRAAFESATLLFKTVRNFSYPLDLRLGDFFRTHRLGVRDRAFVAELIYTAVRNLRFISWVAGSYLGKTANDAQMLKIAAFLNGELEKITPLLTDDEQDFFANFSRDSYKNIPPAVAYSFPDFLFESLKKRFGDETFHVADLMNQAAPLDLRINPLKIKRDAVLKEFSDAVKTPFSPLGIRLKNKIPLAKNPLFLDGKIEVQDEGSQLVALLADARRRQMVFDFCAGAGGKTLVLGAAMANTGTLYAADTSEKRLSKFSARFKKSGLSNIHFLRLESETDPRLKRFKNRFDRVLLDVPCSGTGTLRRNPDLKWRFDLDKLKTLRQTQSAILESAARLVKDGGILLYATCSFLFEENEMAIAEFLENHPNFQRFSLQPIAESLKLNLPDSMFNQNGEFFSSPLFATDAFFATALVKTPQNPR